MIRFRAAKQQHEPRTKQALENGHLIVPDRPGLGIELNDEALEAYPPTSGQRLPVIRQDGSLRDY